MLRLAVREEAVAAQTMNLHEVLRCSEFSHFSFVSFFFGVAVNLVVINCV